MMRAEAGGSSYRYRGLYRGEEQTGRRTAVDGTDAVEVPQRNAAAVLRELSSSDLVDPGRRISKRGGSVLIPVRAEPEVDLSQYGARIVKDARLSPRIRLRDPRTRLLAELAALGIPSRIAPSKWERLGEVVVIRVPPEGQALAATIGQAYGRALRVRTVVQDQSGIHGPLRTPDMRVLWGDGTETVHTEAGVKYRLDVAHVMFSSGNIRERTGISARVKPGEVVVDLFAGIGYFTLPIALQSRPSAIYACERSPLSFRYLVENVRLNRADCVIPLLGDCRETAPCGVADWVLMGHFDGREYLDVAFRALRGRGTIVYHELCPKEQYPDALTRRLAAAARASWMDVRSIRTRIVKSYAPGIVHSAAELEVRRQTRGSATEIQMKDDLLEPPGIE